MQLTQGADFYDGDGDGIYNPVDLNENGIWDPDEDRPDLIGNITLWTVYNDGMAPFLRRFSDVQPQNIEIQQTVYSFSNTEFDLDKAHFIRYKIINQNNSNFDSVYFSIWADSDIGDFEDDLVGSDTLLQSGFTYQNKSDAVFGADPPAFFISLLQGPQSYIPNETFIDVNQNGIYDPDIDTPLDTAYNIKGPYLETEIYPGAKNLKINSFSPYMGSHPINGDPMNKEQLRFYQEGKLPSGELVDPCTWSFSIIHNQDCSNINPRFFYSGTFEPYSGWINNFNVDQRKLLSVGPFDIKSNDTVIIVAAYLVGRGNSPINSVQAGKQVNQNIIEVFNNNFPVVVGVESELNVISDFYLHQNYPNPFNPTTKIKFSIPSNKNPLPGVARGGLVTLKVYDILGKEVAVLVNEEKSPGEYEVNFNAANLSSGVYFYQLKSGDFIQNKKMILLK
jgi:hypothetical protein